MSSKLIVAENAMPQLGGWYHSTTCDIKGGIKKKKKNESCVMLLMDEPLGL